MKLLVLLLSAAVLALSSATVLPTTEVPLEIVPGNVEEFDGLGATPDEVIDEDDETYQVIDEDDEAYQVIDEDDEEETGKISGPKEFDGIDLDLLTEEELDALMGAEDEKFMGELDLYLGTNAIVKRLQSKVARPKRWVPLAIMGGRLAFSAGRAFLSRYARNGLTRSGARITKHYSRPGNYFTGLREFKKLNPTNVKRIGGSKFNGWTGTSGNYRVTVRSGSKGTPGTSGSPTLSLSSKGGDLVRKFRFD